MVFVIQNAQNRDQKAIQLKLDELLRATTNAETGFVKIEETDDESLKELEDQFQSVRDEHAGHESDGHEGEAAREQRRRNSRAEDSDARSGDR